RAVLAADRTDLARAQRQRHVAQRGEAGEALAQAVDGENVHHTHRTRRVGKRAREHGTMTHTTESGRRAHASADDTSRAVTREHGAQARARVNTCRALATARGWPW